MLNQNQPTSSEVTQVAASRSYVFNPNPCYQPPKAGVNPPRLIKAAAKAARENRPSLNTLWRSGYRYHGLTKKLLIEKRSINLHRKRAIDEICVYLANHFNIVTGKVFGSLAQISDACGLTTYNAKGVPSYSRASRAITEHLEAIGAVKVERVWDDTSGSYIPNQVEVTELFFALIGYDYGKVQSAQNQQLAWINKGLMEKGEEPISVTEARQRAKDQHVKAALAARAKSVERKKLEKRANKLSQMDEQDAKYKIQKDLVKMYTKEELAAMGHVEFARLVNERYYTMKKIAASCSPPKPPPESG